MGSFIAPCRTTSREERGHKGLIDDETGCDGFAGVTGARGVRQASAGLQCGRLLGAAVH